MVAIYNPDAPVFVPKQQRQTNNGVVFNPEAPVFVPKQKSQTNDEYSSTNPYPNAMGVAFNPEAPVFVPKQHSQPNAEVVNQDTEPNPYGIDDQFPDIPRDSPSPTMEDYSTASSTLHLVSGDVTLLASFNMVSYRDGPYSVRRVNYEFEVVETTTSWD
ncbi:hypothetical protein CcaverHIS641_0607320 [Cutaneotrichosporon cavernicola]|nr:hypothetical protein CcaverHIS641_0607320 [Cutaneotrichosporon cavernicola]